MKLLDRILRRKEEDISGRIGTKKDIRALRDLIRSGLAVTKGICVSNYVGAYVWAPRVIPLTTEDATKALDILINQEPGVKHPAFMLGSRCFTDVNFTSSSIGKRQSIQLIFKQKESRPGLWFVRKTDNRTYYIVLGDADLEDKLTDVSNMFPELKEPVERAIQDYNVSCMTDFVLPHVRRVHSFEDAVQQAYTIATTGRTDDERYTLALMTFYSHLFDDFVDPEEDITSLLPDYDGSRSLLIERLSDNAVKAMRRMERLVPKEKRGGVKRTIKKIVYGALIQQAGESHSWFDFSGKHSRREQEKYARLYQRFVTHGIKSDALRVDVARLHPMQVWLTSHTAVDMLFAVEPDNTNQDLAELYSIFYAPMLYCHDKEEEASANGEKFNMRYGRELCSGDYISDTHLIELLDIFDTHINDYPDPRRDLRIKQIKILYAAFRPVLSEQLKTRYCLSMQRMNKN